MPKENEEPRTIKAMNPANLLFETAALRRHVFDAPIGTRPEDLCQPEFWKHAVGGRRLRRHDVIRAICVDDSWSAEYLVIYVGRSSAKLKIMKPDADGVMWMTDAALKVETASHYVKFISPNSAIRYGVFRKSDKEEIRRGFTTAEEAANWMHEHLREIAA